MPDKQTLIDGLNEDLAYEYTAMIQYTFNAAAVSGLSRQILKPFFLNEVQDEANHASFLAEKIIFLGGTPTVTPKPVQQTTNVREMIQNALNDEVATIERYKTRVKQADEIGDVALKIHLEDMIAEETSHKEELESLLKDPRL